MRPIDHFDTAASGHAGRVAVIDGEVRLTFQQLQHLSVCIGEALSSLAVASHPRHVAIISGNDYRVLACMLGIMRAGHTIVPVHARNAPETAEAHLSTCAPVCVFYHSSSARLVQRVRQQLPEATPWICLDAEAELDPSLAAFIQAGGTPVADWGGIREEADRPVYLRQTSGTTGPPKLVVDDIASFNASYRVLHYVLKTDAEDPVFLAVAPLSHACGVFAFSMLTLGATVVVMSRFDPGDVLQAVERHRVTHLWLPPTALYLLLDSPDVRAADCSSLRSLVLGASAVSADRLREAVEIFGPCVSMNYSQIESGFLTWLDARTIADGLRGHHPERLKSSGQSLFVGRVAVMDDEGMVLPSGQEGEIVVRGASVKNYVNPDDTAEARRYGWHHTGDLGYIDDDGYLFVTGRAKDVIITSGYKVSATEVERIIMERQEVRECAVVAAPDELRGEVVAAVIVFRDGAVPSAGVIRDHCRARLGEGLTPRVVELWRDLPKTAVGKVDKRSVRERLRQSMQHRHSDESRDPGSPLEA